MELPEVLQKRRMIGFASKRIFGNKIERERPGLLILLNYKWTR